MNRRTLKKKCQRAMAILVAKYGYSPDQFSPSDGHDAIDAPSRMERRFVDGNWLNPGPLKGTPLFWRKVSCEYDEWDAKLPTDELSDLEHWSNFTEAEAMRMLAATSASQ